MTNSKTFSINRCKMPFNWIIAVFLAFGALGFIDSLYLVFKYYFDSPLECVILIGCDVVQKSQYAEIFNIPVALLGAIYYFAIIFLIVAFLFFQRQNIIAFAAYFTIIGFLVSLWLLYLQFFVIKAICFYCLISATTSTALFIAGIIFIAIKIGKN